MQDLRRTLVGMLVVSIVVSVAVVGSALAQRTRVSPRGTVEAHVDGASISMEYGRPYKRGRVIWGSLVPWNHWWMPGSDESTTITTDAAGELVPSYSVRRWNPPSTSSTCPAQ